MADGLITAEANSLLNTLLAAFPYIQMHTAAPGAAGTSNVAANSTRELASWNSASGASASNSADLSWPSVPASETYTDFSAWSASSAGTCGFTGTISAPGVVTGDTFKLLAGDLVVSFTPAS